MNMAGRWDHGARYTDAALHLLRGCFKGGLVATPPLLTVLFKVHQDTDARDLSPCLKFPRYSSALVKVRHEYASITVPTFPQ